MMHSFYENDGLVVPMSHAGDTSAAPAGSLAAYQAAYDMGYRYFQADVVRIGNDELVSAHAIAGRKPTWEDESLDDLRTEHPELTSIDELAGAFPDAKWNIEVKSMHASEPLLAFLRRQPDLSERYSVSAPFHGRLLKKVRSEFGPDLCTSSSLLEGSLVGWPLVPGTSREGAAVQVLYVLARWPGRIAALTADGVQYQAWPVNDEKHIRRLLDGGVRGIITDNHQLLKDILIERGEWKE